jgi:quinol monooxygenase YgiN
MAKINSSDNILTLINTFDVDQNKQQALTDLLVKATTDVMRNLDGFISANLHMSLDGKHVANYAQWKSKAHFEAMLDNPEAKIHMKQAGAIANKITPILYEVAHSDDAPA